MFLCVCLTKKVFLNHIASFQTDSPEREVYRDPDVVRCDDKLDEESTIKRSQTASRMLSVFRQLEEQKEVVPDGKIRNNDTK